MKLMDFLIKDKQELYNICVYVVKTSPISWNNVIDCFLDRVIFFNWPGNISNQRIIKADSLNYN